MNYKITTIKNVSILKPKGRFDAYQVPDIDTCLEQAINQSPCIVMDFSDVIFTDTRALAMLVKWLKKTREQHGDLKLCSLQKSVKIILELSRLNLAFRIYETLSDGVAAFEDVAVALPPEFGKVPMTQAGTVTVMTAEHAVHVITLDSRVDTFHAPQLKTQFEAYTESESQRFVVDLTQVEFLDSAGLALLVTLLKQARAKQGEVVLVWSKLDAANRILRLTQFDKVFPMAYTVSEGQAHFQTAI
jgi:anti-anti-sigma factor